MAEGQIQRQAVQALPQRKRRAQPSQTVDTFFQSSQPSTEPSKASRIVQGLFDFTGKAVDYSVRQEKKKIELDKVTQQQRALQGLDPTEDATDEGVRAYQLVNMRDQVLQTNADLAQHIRDNPDMSDEEFELATRDAYAPLFDQYQPDAQLSSALSNKLQESQTQIYQIRGAAEREHHEFQKEESFKQGIEAYREASSSPEEMLANIQEGGQLANEADALGVTPEQYRNGLIEMAQLDASTGDGRLLRAIEQTEWASTDERVSKAKEMYRKWEAEENAVAIGTRWGEIQQAWKNRSRSWGQIQQDIQNLNDRFPGSVTANQVASLRQQAAAQHQRDSDRAALFERIISGETRLGSDARISSGMRDDAIEDFSEIIESQADQMVAQGQMEEADAQTWVLQQKLRFGKEQGVAMPNIRPLMENLALEDPTQWDGNEVPAQFNHLLKAIPMMNESDIERYGANERTRNMMREYQRFLSSNLPSKDAWDRSYNSITAAQNMSPEQRGEVSEAARESVDEELDRSFVDRWLWGDKEDVPDNLRNIIRETGVREANAVIGGGSANPEGAAEAGADRAVRYNTILDSGTFVRNLNQDLLLQRSQYTDANGIEQGLRQDDMSPAFENYFEQHKESFMEESPYYGEDLDIQKIFFDASSNGMIIIRDDQHEPLSEPISVQEITEQYIQDVSNQRATRAILRTTRQQRDQGVGEGLRQRMRENQ